MNCWHYLSYMEKTRVINLLQSFANGACTSTEEKELAQLLSDPQYDLLLGNLIEDLFDNPPAMHNLREDQSRRILEKVLKRKMVPAGKFPWKTLAAAASLFLVISIAIWMLMYPFQSGLELAELPPKSIFGGDVPPGGHVAYLTLANDSVVMLDQFTTGSRIQQKDATILKTKEGELLYNEKETRQKKEAEYHTLKVPNGGQFKLVLADGSQVWLNAASSIRFPSAFTGHERRVELKGEAYFEIRHNPEMPFIVSILDHPGAPEGMEIEVFGTEFNVSAYVDETAIATTLVEGSVGIGRKGPISGYAILQPGQQALMDENMEITIMLADLFEVTAWKEGIFIFNNEHIESIMRKLARWYDLEVEYSGELKYTEFSGMISRYENVSKVLEKFQMTGVINFAIEDQRVRVHP